MAVDRHLNYLWGGRRCKVFELPAQAPPWFRGVDHAVDDTDMFNGIEISLTSFDTDIG